MKTLRIAVLAAYAALSNSVATHAQTSPPNVVNTVQVEPVAAPAGTPRKILVTIWSPTPCGPVGARLETSRVNDSRVLTFVLEPRVPPPPCVSLWTAFTFTLSYTPEAEGDLRVILLNGSVWAGEGTISTRNVPTQRSVHDLTGMWYDPATNGSGLTFVHAAPRNDAVFGTWFLYDAQRNPRWYTIQNVFWKPGGLEAEGVLYSASAAINVCPLTIIGCPTAATLIAPMARARIAMQSATTARIEALRPDGSVIFSSNIIKGAI